MADKPHNTLGISSGTGSLHRRTLLAGLTPILLGLVNARDANATRDISANLRAICQDLRRRAPQLPHVSLMVVDAETNNVHVGIAGNANAVSGRRMRAITPWRTASIGKLVMGVTVLRLIEDGAIALDMPIAQRLPADLLSGLHVLGGVDYGSRITVRQLLGHQSGLPDYFTDGGDGQSLPPFFQELLAHPNRLWSPEATIEWTKRHLRPLFPPGRGGHYGDTGFQLLGLLVERVTGKALHQAYRDIVFRPLGMDDTWMPWREPARGISKSLEPADVLFGELEIGGQRALSADWGGGGLVSTSNDLIRFWRCVREGRVFRDPRTLGLMTQTLHRLDDGEIYGLAVEREGQPGPLLRFGHEGAWGTFLFHAPARNLYVAGTVGQFVYDTDPAKDDPAQLALRAAL